MTTATMTFFTIDTLQFSKRLQKAGLDQKIAEEFAEVIKDSQNQSVEGLATKQDVLIVKNEVSLVKKDLEIMNQKIESSKQEIIIKTFLMLTAAVAAITWLDKVIK